METWDAVRARRNVRAFAGRTARRADRPNRHPAIVPVLDASRLLRGGGGVHERRAAPGKGAAKLRVVLGALRNRARIHRQVAREMVRQRVVGLVERPRQRHDPQVAVARGLRGDP